MGDEYRLEIGRGLGRTFRAMGAVARDAVIDRLHAIAHEASRIEAPLPGPPLDPPLRFYAEGYRVLYRVDGDVRRVAVLEVARAFA